MTTTCAGDDDLAWFAPAPPAATPDAAALPPVRVADEIERALEASAADESPQEAATAMTPAEAAAETELRDSEAARRAFLAHRYPDASLDASYQTADMVYLRWRERLEYARRTHDLAAEELVDGLATEPRAPNAAGVRQFLAASPRLTAFAHLPERADDDAASAAAQKRLDAVLDDDKRSLGMLAVAGRIDAAVLRALTTKQRAALLRERRTLGDEYRTERGEAAARALATRGSVPPSNVYDRRIDAYVQRTARLARCSVPTECADDSGARALIAATPWSGARLARPVAGVVSFAAQRAGTPVPRTTHLVLGTGAAFARYAESAGAYARDQLAAVRWRTSELLLARLPSAAERGEEVVWTRAPVAIHDGARVALQPGAAATHLFLVQQPANEAVLRLARYVVPHDGRKLRAKQLLRLPELADVPVAGLDASAAHLVLLQVDGTLSVLPRSRDGGHVECDAGYSFCLPLATCMALARTADGASDALWVGDEAGFVYELTLGGDAPRWTRTLWTGDLERVLQVQARGTRVAALTPTGAYVWDLPDEYDNDDGGGEEGEEQQAAQPPRRIFKPVVLRMPEVLSIALHGSHLAVLDRLGTLTFIHVRAQTVDGQCDALHAHLRAGARLHYSAGRAGGCGAAYRHVQWDGDGTAAWIAYPSGSALLRVAFDVPPPPPPPPSQ